MSITSLNMAATGGSNIRCFRDYLNEHPDVAREYEALKKESALKFPDNERQYADAKKAFVDEILRLTESE